MVLTASNVSIAEPDSCFSCGNTSRNHPMTPLIARIAPRRLTDGLVTIPAKTRVRPKARMIGQAVVSGISILSVRLSARGSVSVLILFSIQLFHSAADDVDHGEDHDPN